MTQYTIGGVTFGSRAPTRYADCDPGVCPNGKCNATGECVEAARPTYTLDSLLDGITEANLHPEVPLSSPTYQDIIRKHLDISERHRLIDTDSATRKTFPMAAGLLDYFPDALAAVAQVSHIGNEKHNPGEPMHHARGKSMDHADCIMRHLVGRGGFDGDTRHSAALAWRALALLQEELEREMGLSLPRGARAA
jgi:hypothetical protein